MSKNRFTDRGISDTVERGAQCKGAPQKAQA